MSEPTSGVPAPVEAAGATKPVLYYYFRNKEGLCRAVLEDAHEQFREMATGALATEGDPVERLVQFIAVHFDMVRRETDLARFFYGMLLGLGGRDGGGYPR